MPTVQCDDIKVELKEGEPLEVAAALIHQATRARWREQALQYARDNNHFHQFDRDRRCMLCQMTELKYNAVPAWEAAICTGWIPGGSRTAQAALSAADQP